MIYIVTLQRTETQTLAIEAGDAETAEDLALMRVDGSPTDWRVASSEEVPEYASDVSSDVDPHPGTPQRS